MSTIETAIAGVGSHLPGRVVTNQDLAKIVDTSDDWIRSRSGIGQRHIANDDEVTSDFATTAAWRALDQAGLKPRDIELIIVATVTPDKTFPSTAVYVQQKLGAPPGIAFDVSAACAGCEISKLVSRIHAVTAMMKPPIQLSVESSIPGSIANPITPWTA